MDPELNLIEDPKTDTIVEPPKPDRGDVVAAAQPSDTAAAKDAPAELPADAPVAPGKKQGSDHVPIGRFNEVNTEKKELAARLEAAEAELERIRTTALQKPAPPTEPEKPVFDEDAQESAYTEALLDGDTAKANAIRKAINANIREQAVATATETIRGESVAREQTSTLANASQQAVADFPYLDTPDGAEAVELIIASRDRRVTQGVPIAEALRQAVEAIAPKFAPAKDTPDVVADPAKDTRSANALARGAADSVAQPPAILAGIGNRATAQKVDVSQLTEEQFDALTPAEKKKLRGD